MEVEDKYADGVLNIKGEGSLTLNSDTPWYERQTPEQRQRDLSILLRSGYMSRHQFELLMEEVMKWCEKIKPKTTVATLI